MCECGNACYKITGGQPGNYEVEWAHDPKDCPFDCEDCENELGVRKVEQKSVKQKLEDIEVWATKTMLESPEDSRIYGWANEIEAMAGNINVILVGEEG